jgi:UDP-GlcNAc:undecaprenyl-phosphate/decaprenyl-phosphate GlcNAc-1-phosphate transferase
MSSTPLISGALAFLLTVLLVPIVIRLCNRWQIFDRPGPLKIHPHPVPRLGGIAVALALVASILSAEPPAAIHAWPFFAALMLVWVTGLVDDVRSLSVLFRLAAQIAAAVLLWRGGWVVPLSGTGPASLFATCTVVVAFVNSLNFIDGSDGLAAGIAGIIAAAYALALAQSPRTDALGTAVACATAGACLGFLPFNFAPAKKIFLGDSGSTSLGLCIAYLSLNFWRSAHATPPRMLFPILVAALPLLDATLAVFRRLRIGVSPLYGDRRHFYDLLLARGWSPRRTAVWSYTITSVFVGIAWWGERRESQQFWLVAVLSALLLIVFAVKLGSLRPETEKSLPRLPVREVRKDVAGLD